MKKIVVLSAAVLLSAGVYAQQLTNEFNYFTSLTLSVPMKNHLGPMLVKADGSTVPTETLSGKVVGLFFSASWNDGYVDQLKTLYTALKKEGKPFEIVWVSNDVSKDDMMKFMREKQIPWPAVAFDRLSVLNLRFQYNVRFDPTLLIINSPGSVFSEEGLKDISVFGGTEAFAKWLELRPIPFQGQTELVQYPPKAPINKDPMALDDLLEQRGSMAGDVVEMLFNEVISIEMVDSTTYRARIRYREGDVTTGETVISFPAEGYSFFKKLLGQGEMRRIIYVQVSHPGFPLRVLGNDYSKKHNEYSWED